MLKKVPTNSLVPGVYVENMDLPWTEYPYLYQQSGILESQEQITMLCAEGYEEAIIDTNRGLPGASAVFVREIPDDLCDLPAVPYRMATIPLWEELSTAKFAYATGLAFSRTLRESVYEKRAIDIAAARRSAVNIVESLQRNTDALVLLSKFSGHEPYDITHPVNSAIYATAFARYMGHDQEMLVQVALAALLHDVGKFLVPENILNKPDKLTRMETAAMAKHPEFSCQYLEANVEELGDVVMSAIAGHHERFNGLGYPGKLQGDAVPEAARLLCIADVYDALTSMRAYKNPLPLHKALGVMYGMNGEDFHPGYVKQFIKCLGLFPAGTLVQLNTGQQGIVAAANHDDPLRPLLTLATDPRGRPSPPDQLELNGKKSFKIEGTPDHIKQGIDPIRILESTRSRQ